MARKQRVEFEGGLYHVMCRGDRQEPIFLDPEDRLLFLKTLGEACERTGWRVHAYVLMRNHYHWLLETPRANLVRGMQWFQTTYTARFNSRHRLAGHVFQGRYKAILIDPEDGGYYVTVSDYIHLNPARAGLLPAGGRLRDYRWSSLPSYGLGRTQRPAWMETGVVLAELGWRDGPLGRRAYLRRLEALARQGTPPEVKEPLRQGWCLGDDAFKERMLDRIEEKVLGSREGKLRAAHSDNDHAERRAERLVLAGMREFGLKEAHLQQMKKSDPRKRIIGWLVRRQTTVSLKWISARLHMGVISRVSRLCRDSVNLTGKEKSSATRLERMSRSKA
jgi:putative transposase